MKGDIRQKFSSPKWLTIMDKLSLTGTSKNWRVFNDGESSIAHGAWRLKTEWSLDGDPHVLLHENLAALHELSGFEHILYERALSQEQRGGASNESNDILVELLGHVKSFYSAYRKAGLCRTIFGIHRASWQKDFIGSQRRGTKRKAITELYEQRALQLGFHFRKIDEAAAIGVLTYGLLTRKIQPPWLDNEILRSPLLGVA